MSFTDPSAGYPSSTLSRSDVGLQNNRASFTLDEDIDSSQTSFQVAEDTSDAPSQGVLTIDNERIKYTSKDDSKNEFSGMTRGFDGSTASSHDQGRPVDMNVVAFHHNRVFEEVIAIQSELGTSPSGDDSDIDTRISNLETPEYVTLSTDGALDNERTLAAGSGLGLTDGGAGSDVTVSANAGAGLSLSSDNIILDESYAATWTAEHDFSGGGLILPTGSAPTPTTEGKAVWETDVDKLRIGDGASTVTLVKEARTLTSGAGLAGGGDLSSDRTLSVNTATGLTVNSDNLDYDISALTEETSPDGANDTVVVHDSSAGNHKKVILDNVGVSDAEYVTLSTDSGLDNERVLSAGSGLASTDGGAGGNITLDVNAGDGISLSNDNVILDESFSPTWSSSHTFDADITVGTTLIEVDVSANQTKIGGPGSQPATGDLANDQIIIWFDDTNDKAKFRAKDGSGNDITGTLGAAGGNVSNSGTPSDNELAVWVDSTTIEGDTNLTWDGSDFKATDGTRGLRLLTSSTDFIQMVPSDDPGSTALNTNELAFFLDEANDQIQVRAKESGGTDLTETLGSGGSSADPGGSDHQIQFNNAGSLGGASGFRFDDGNSNVEIDSSVSFILAQSTANYTIAWNDPSAARTYTIPDTGGNDTFLFESRTLTGGTGINTLGDLSADRTVSIDQSFSPTWTSSHTWDTGTAANINLDEVGLFFNTSNAETLNFRNTGTGSVTVQEDGTAVVTETRSLTGGHAIQSIGDLSADRTVAVDATDLDGTALNASGASQTLDVAGPFTSIDFKTSGDVLQYQTDANNDLILQNTTDAVTLHTIDQDTGDLTYNQLGGTPSMGTHDHSESGTSTIPNAGLANTSVSFTAGTGIATDGDGSLTLGGAGETLSVDFADDEDLTFGSGDDYTLRYDSGNTQLELENSSGNIIYSVADGGQELDFQATPTVTGTHVVLESRSLTGGNAIDAIGDLTQDRTIAVSSSAIQTNELDLSISPTWTSSHTWDTGTAANLSLDEVGLFFSTSNTETLNFRNTGSGSVNIQEDGTEVVKETRSLAGGIGIQTIGDLSSDRTVSIDESDALTWTAKHDFSSGDVVLPTKTSDPSNPDTGQIWIRTDV